MLNLSKWSQFFKSKPEPILIKKELSANEVRIERLERELKELIKCSQEADYDYNLFEEKLIVLSTEISEATEEAHYSDLIYRIEDLSDGLNRLKKETNFFEQDERLDLEFIDSVDSDFDEESMSYQDSQW